MEIKSPILRQYYLSDLNADYCWFNESDQLWWGNKRSQFKLCSDDSAEYLGFKTGKTYQLVATTQKPRGRTKYQVLTIEVDRICPNYGTGELDMSDLTYYLNDEIVNLNDDTEEWVFDRLNKRVLKAHRGEKITMYLRVVEVKPTRSVSVRSGDVRRNSRRRRTSRTSR